MSKQRSEWQEDGLHGTRPSFLPRPPAGSQPLEEEADADLGELPMTPAGIQDPVGPVQAWGGQNGQAKTTW